MALTLLSSHPKLGNERIAARQRLYWRKAVVSLSPLQPNQMAGCNLFARGPVYKLCADKIAAEHLRRNWTRPFASARLAHEEVRPLFSDRGFLAFIARPGSNRPKELRCRKVDRCIQVNMIELLFVALLLQSLRVNA